MRENGPRVGITKIMISAMKGVKGGGCVGLSSIRMGDEDGCIDKIVWNEREKMKLSEGHIIS